MTSLVHGEDAARAADAAAEVLFGGDPTSAPLEALEVVAREVPTTVVPLADLDAGLDLVSVLTRTGLATSNGAARVLLSQGGLAVNGRKVSAEDELRAADLLHGQVALLRKGAARTISSPKNLENRAEGPTELTVPRASVGWQSASGGRCERHPGLAGPPAVDSRANRHQHLPREARAAEHLWLLENGREDEESQCGRPRGCLLGVRGVVLCQFITMLEWVPTCSGASWSEAQQLLTGSSVSAFTGRDLNGEFDPGSGRTLAACFIHASRTRSIEWQHS